jgi:hypothetical protein
VLRERVAALHDELHRLERLLGPVERGGQYIGHDIVSGRADEAVLGPDTQRELAAGLEGRGVCQHVAFEARIARPPDIRSHVLGRDERERRGRLTLGILPEDAVRDVVALVRVQREHELLKLGGMLPDERRDALRVLVGRWDCQRATRVEVSLLVDHEHA